MPKKKGVNYIEDAALWQRVTAEVTPLKSTTQSNEFEILFPNLSKSHGKHLIKRANNRAKNTPKGIAAHPDLDTKKIANLKKVKPVDLRYGERGGIDRGTQRRLFRGEVAVESRLDLHGMTAVRAQNQLIQFIESSVSQGCRCVLVITGKGLGVLRGHVPDWLKQPPLAADVLALAEARPKDGGSGAFYVLLRRKRGGK